MDKSDKSVPAKRPLNHWCFVIDGIIDKASVWSFFHKDKIIPIWSFLWISSFLWFFCTGVTFGHMIYQHVQYIWMIPRIIWSSRWCVIKIQSCQVYVIGAVQFVFWNWPNVIPIVGVLKCMWEWHDDVECQNHGNISFLFPFLKSDWRFVTSNLCVQYSEMMRENSFTF